jgi:hypothetical protein
MSAAAPSGTSPNPKGLAPILRKESSALQAEATRQMGNPLDLIEGDLVARAVVELGRPCGLVELLAEGE